MGAHKPQGGDGLQRFRNKTADIRVMYFVRMRRYKITSAGRSYEPRVKHNKDAWDRMRALLDRRGECSEEELREAIRNCRNRYGEPNGGFFGYAVRGGWIKQT